MNHDTPFPVEIISLILGDFYEWDLKQFALVSRQFRAAAYPLMWRDRRIWDKRLFTRLLTVLQLSPPQKGVGKHIRTLLINVNFSDDDLLILAKHLPALKELELEQARDITDTGIEHLAHHCPLLEKLTIRHSRHVTDRSILSIANHCSHLSSLVLEKCRLLTPSSGVFGSLEKCTSLRKLDIDLGACKKDFATDWVGVSKRLVLDLLKLPFLTNLLLVDCSPTFCRIFFDNVASREKNHNATTDADAAATACCCWPDLTEFWLEGCRGVGDLAMTNFIKTHPLLTRLSLSKSDFSEQLLSSLPTLLPHLDALMLTHNTWVSAHMLRSLVVNFPGLRYVDVVMCRIRDRGFPEVHYSHKDTMPENDDDDLIMGCIDDDPKYLVYLDANDMAGLRRTGIVDPSQYASSDSDGDDYGLSDFGMRCAGYSRYNRNRRW
ncbi:unnamed protein product [Absidia cylindrospora]